MSQQWIVLESFYYGGLEHSPIHAYGPFDTELDAEADVQTRVNEYNARTGRRSGQDPKTSMWESMPLNPDPEESP